MKIKKIGKNLIYLFIYLIYSISINADEFWAIPNTSIYLNEPIIEGITTRVNFSARVTVISDRVVKGQYIDLKNWKWTVSDNSFVIAENLKLENENSSRDRIFFKNEGDIVDDNIEFTITGVLRINWKYANNSFDRVKIGEMQVNQEGKNQNFGNVYLKIDDNIDLVSSLKVNTIQNMDFGTIIAKTVGDTSSSGQPAIVEVKGLMNRDVKVIIPQTTEIYNDKSKDSLIVMLNFRDKNNLSTKGNEQSITKPISIKTEGNLGKTENIVIDGKVQTKENSRGFYKGQFKVRVEYDY